MSGADSNAEKPRIGRPFEPGNKANPGGRPKGSRNKLGEQFLTDMYADWQENGTAVIASVRTEKPDVYLKVVASILPKELNIKQGAFDGVTDEQLAALVVAAKSALGFADEADSGKTIQ